MSEKIKKIFKVKTPKFPKISPPKKLVRFKFVKVKIPRIKTLKFPKLEKVKIPKLPKSS